MKPQGSGSIALIGTLERELGAFEATATSIIILDAIERPSGPESGPLGPYWDVGCTDTPRAADVS